jgi:hypothetical protein
MLIVVALQDKAGVLFYDHNDEALTYRLTFHAQIVKTHRFEAILRSSLELLDEMLCTFDIFAVLHDLAHHNADNTLESLTLSWLSLAWP